LHGFDLQPDRAIIDSMEHHARINMRLEARGVARHKARAQLQITADTAHIGFDRQTARAGEIGEII